MSRFDGDKDFAEQASEKARVEAQHRLAADTANCATTTSQLACLPAYDRLLLFRECHAP